MATLRLTTPRDTLIEARMNGKTKSRQQFKIG
jgi:hypothetical protein